MSAAQSASGVLGCTTLPIVVGPDPQALSSVTSVAASHSRDCLSPPPDRERLCSRGPLAVMSSLCCRDSLALRGQAVTQRPQVAATQGSVRPWGRLGSVWVLGVGIKRRVICQGLRNDYTMAAPSPLLHHDACPLLRMDPVGPLIRW